MNLKKIIFYHPSFEKGGVEKILINLIENSIKQKIINSRKNLNRLLILEQSEKYSNALRKIWEKNYYFGALFLAM